MSDQTIKRQQLARAAIVAVKKYQEARMSLIQLADERAQSGNFLDSDFSGIPEFQHLDAGMAGVLFDFVVPSIQENYLDSANSGRNKQILLQVANDPI